MEGDLAKLSAYLEDVHSPDKVVREQAEAVIQKAIKDDLAAYSQAFIALLASEIGLTIGELPSSLKVTACIMLEKHLRQLLKEPSLIPSDSFFEALQDQLFRTAVATPDKQTKRMCSFLIGEVSKLIKRHSG